MKPNTEENNLDCETEKSLQIYVRSDVIQQHFKQIAEGIFMLLLQ